MGNRYASLAEKFVEKLVDADGCWEWGGARFSPDGYGKVRHNGRQLLAHRVAYELLVGPIPEELTIDHLCGNHGCVNPRHLEPVTRGENARRYTRTITHCPKGHEYDGANTRWNKDGKRACRACERERWRAKYGKH